MNAAIPSVSSAAGLPRELDAVFDRALAKDPAQRYETGAGFVAALRAAFADAVGSTRELPAVMEPHTTTTRPLHKAEEFVRVPYRRGRSRVVWPLLAALLLLGAIGGALLAYALTRADSKPARTTVVTQTQRVTTQGQVTTVEKPVTVTTSPSGPRSSSTSGVALNNAGYAKMQAGDYTGALPLLERAVQKLQGTNSLDEAYADYNLAYTRFQLGNCDGVLDLLDRSESIQGHRPAIDSLRQQAQENC